MKDIVVHRKNGRKWDEVLELGKDIELGELADEYREETDIECVCGYEGDYEVSISVEPLGDNKYSNEPHRIVSCPGEECSVEEKAPLGNR